MIRVAAVIVLPIVVGSCSAQPMTLNQELMATAVAGTIGAVSGAAFAYEAKQSYPASIGIGAGGMAGFILIYEEVKREAAQENLPEPPPPPEPSSQPGAP